MSHGEHSVTSRGRKVTISQTVREPGRDIQARPAGQRRRSCPGSSQAAPASAPQSWAGPERDAQNTALAQGTGRHSDAHVKGRRSVHDLQTMTRKGSHGVLTGLAVCALLADTLMTQSASETLIPVCKTNAQGHTDHTTTHVLDRRARPRCSPSQMGARSETFASAAESKDTEVTSRTGPGANERPGNPGGERARARPAVRLRLPYAKDGRHGQGQGPTGMAPVFPPPCVSARPSALRRRPAPSADATTVPQPPVSSVWLVESCCLLPPKVPKKKWLSGAGSQVLPLLF